MRESWLQQLTSYARTSSWQVTFVAECKNKLSIIINNFFGYNVSLNRKHEINIEYIYI